MKTNPFVGLPHSSRVVLLKLYQIKRRSPHRLHSMTRSDLAQELGMTREGLRLHLNVLAKKGVVWYGVNDCDGRARPIHLSLNPTDDVMTLPEAVETRNRIARKEAQNVDNGQLGNLPDHLAYQNPLKPLYRIQNLTTVSRKGPGRRDNKLPLRGDRGKESQSNPSLASSGRFWMRPVKPTPNAPVYEIVRMDGDTPTLVRRINASLSPLPVPGIKPVPEQPFVPREKKGRKPRWRSLKLAVNHHPLPEAPERIKGKKFAVPVINKKMLPYEFTGMVRSATPLPKKFRKYLIQTAQKARKGSVDRWMWEVFVYAEAERLKSLYLDLRSRAMGYNYADTWKDKGNTWQHFIKAARNILELQVTRDYFLRVAVDTYSGLVKFPTPSQLAGDNLLDVVPVWIPPEEREPRWKRDERAKAEAIQDEIYQELEDIRAAAAFGDLFPVEVIKRDRLRKEAEAAKERAEVAKWMRQGRRKKGSR